MPEPSNPPPSWTYAMSGVDRASVGSALSELLRQVRYRAPPSHGRPIPAPGHYAGFVRIGRETLAITTDTVGTKVELARRLDRWEEVGEDVVAVNVNDLAAVGARPAGLVDTILCEAPSPEVFRSIGRGIDRGLRSAGASLLGGETAVVPSLIRGLDLGGTAIGFFPGGRRPVVGDRIRPGDVLLGIPSTGLHANGFTLVRRLLDERSIDLATPRPGAERPVGAELLTPTRIYTRATDALAGPATTHGFAHVSGGGVRNLLRLHPRVSYVLDHWPKIPSLFGWVQSLGSISDQEMFQTFNMGVGFVVVVAPTRLSETRRRLARAGAADAVPIGHVERGSGVHVPALGLRYDSYA